MMEKEKEKEKEKKRKRESKAEASIPIDVSEHLSATADVTAVFTACGRPDLLAKTLKSFFQYLREPLRAVIVVEDSGTFCNCNLRKQYPQIVWLENPTNIGQILSVDRAYALVETPYIFHCEDDWEFKRSGFIEESRRILLAHPTVFSVMLRGSGLFSPYKVERRLADGTQLCYGMIGDYPASFSFNPGLRRLSDYLASGEYNKLVVFDRKHAGSAERALAHLHKRAGFRLAILGGGAVVQHIGGFRHVHVKEFIKRSRRVTGMKAGDFDVDVDAADTTKHDPTPKSITGEYPYCTLLQGWDAFLDNF